MGISNAHHVVVYDRNDKYGLFSSPRVWWMFRVSMKFADGRDVGSLLLSVFLQVFGHLNVSVLDGGLTYWKQSQYPVQTGPPQIPCPQPYTATHNPDLVKTMQQVLKYLNSGEAQVSRLAR